ncbi:GNAT family N-acetyltransferase [Clostridium sp. 'deep sea']|uniref:GNAT family N-acetyltransferase n=1 Tax=Clostridium sp. 'deep sea' TaxID=2779445 RepID=UPI001896A4FE|nr:GNAT family N-acetyltransferase [Clostridium sp. 'deep sea']QOR36550.1 GNAT family N-acetyltransferase [Clostridium sp. 'deep sea']
MNKQLIKSLSSYLACAESLFEKQNVSVVCVKNDSTKSACGQQGLLAVSTSAGVIIQADSVYCQELKNIYEGYNKLDFFEANNLSLLESLVREFDKMLSGPYLVLHKLKPKQDLISNDYSLRIELKTTNNSDLFQYEGFDNALSYQENKRDEFTLILWNKHQPVAIATATQLHHELYSIGINVLPKWRRKNIGLLALSKLTEAILNKGKIPHYSVSIANTASINLALKAGYSISYCTVYTV